MLPRPRFFSLRPLRSFQLLRRNVTPSRTLIAAPKPGSGPLMDRRSDRELPSLQSSHRWLRTLPIFLFILGVSTLAIFNYQKASSSVVNSTLYALRTNREAREVLGDEIYFNSQMPWIWGELNQLHGRINVQFWVKGRKAKGLMKFRSERRTRRGYFETLEWSLELDDGTVINLLQSDDADPFTQATVNGGAPAEMQGSI
ncbi:hypothetical protein B0A49_08859 [Cryomyces minteri]|uniref:Cytochrome c oxidase assembly factor 1 n=2 Tax=Cryomyces minteri TaxID=331657 RepID=A0A4U0WMF8_9PEZI|nr:hypothetical protein B0A49_08329 [Cryomyces minteri]TKA64402.1 hypothetical protein B0A49_08859 [Cryomyces minteri]